MHDEYAFTLIALGVGFYVVLHRLRVSMLSATLAFARLASLTLAW